MTTNVLLRGALVVDGTGAARRRADVALRDGVITAVGALASAEAGTTVDLDGLVTAGKSPPRVTRSCSRSCRCIWRSETPRPNELRRQNVVRRSLPARPVRNRAKISYRFGVVFFQLIV